MSVTILRGYPASGKTTWAREKASRGNHVIVSRDVIRAQITGTEEKLLMDHASENAVTKIAEAQAKAAIKDGWHVIVDATNLRRKQAVAWADLAVSQGVGYRVVDFKTPPQICVYWNSLRENPVEADVIENYARRFPIKNWPEIKHNEQPVFKPYERDTTKPPAVIFDLDGTLCNMNGRDPYDASTCEEDLPREAVLSALEFVPHYVDVLFMSGRSAEFFEETANWLGTHSDAVVDENSLFMRAVGDNRKDSIIKSELFDKHIAGNYNVLFIYDDRNQVVDMWRQKGLDCFQVAEGNF